MSDFAAERQRMVATLEARGLHDRAVLEAMGRVRREAFVPDDLRQFAYADAPLPIGAGQTISQPFVVALMCQALEVKPEDRILDVGAGSGYAAAVLAELGREVYTIERHGALAEKARDRLIALGYENVEVRHGDGTRGWPEAAPFDAIMVAAGGPDVPRSLRAQLAVGGRLVIPVGATRADQSLLRVVRESETEYREEDLGPVRFVPLVGAEAWPEEGGGNGRPAGAWQTLDPGGPGAAPYDFHRSVPARQRARRAERDARAVGLVRDRAEVFEDLGTADLDPLLDRIGDARVVLVGEATHGTSEFYRMRARITRALVEQRGLHAVAVEADWPDAAQIDHYVRHRETPPAEWTAFARFPVWMWRNGEVLEFAERLRAHNASLPYERRIRFAGLDIYSLYSSLHAVLEYLDGVDPEAARVARERYGCRTTCGRRSWTSGSSGPSASSTARRPSSRATTSRRSCRGSSTSGSGSTRAAP